jgi:hypothetical protein
VNEHIKQLADQCTEVLWRDGPYEREEFNKEKFAELIVRECMSYMEDGDIDFAKFMIKKHFGVEE